MRRAFGFLFVAVSIAVGAGAVLAETVSAFKLPIYYQAAAWLASFGTTFGISANTFRKILPAIRDRMKNSVAWPTTAKALNGVCWAGPFAAIGLFPQAYHFLLLLGIGLGNLSTYLLMKEYSGLDNREQAIVGIISLLAIPIAFELDRTFALSNHDVSVMLSRVLIAIAYALGGLYALIVKETH